MLSVDISLPRDRFSVEVSHAFDIDGVTALFGPSGCGKSSLLRVIAGHEAGAVGSVICDAEQWLGKRIVPPHQRQVGYVFQEARLFPHLDVTGNLAYAEKRAKRDIGIARADVVEALGLTDLMHRTVQDLSGGERQRVSIARSLLSQPKLMLMDEPLAALDLRAKMRILPLIADLPKRFGVPVIYVTHALDEVAQVADHVVTMKEGKLIGSGPVGEMLEQPEMQGLVGRFEAGSILRAVVKAHDRDLLMTRVDVDGLPFEMPFMDVPVGYSVRLRVRARDVTLAVKRPEGISTRNIHEGRVIKLMPEQGSAFAEVLVDLGPCNVQARITRAAVEDLELVEGRQVFALIKSVSFDRRALPMVNS